MTDKELENLMSQSWNEYPGLLKFDAHKFGRLVAAAERERCAKVAAETVCDMHRSTGVNIYGTRAAAAIRARE